MVPTSNLRSEGGYRAPETGALRVSSVFEADQVNTGKGLVELWVYFFQKKKKENDLSGIQITIENAVQPTMQ